jgi:signal transduction histidine kinase
MPARNVKEEHGADRPGGFRLLRHFIFATLLAFSAVALALFVLQRMEESFFEQVQREHGAFLARAQGELARQHGDAARRSLIAVHEAGHLNLARLTANLLWESDFGPFVQAAQRIPVAHCRALPAGGPGSPDEAARRTCFAEVGAKLMALPAFRKLDTRAYAAMRASTVFKIKVFDLRQVTVYSSEHAQIGEDAAGNLGVRHAVAGRPASELTHRDRFSAFERVVEDRDVISTYVPMRDAGGAIVGVFEIYSDATPFLDQAAAASHRFAAIAAANETEVARSAQNNLEQVVSNSHRFLATVGGLLALLYVASLLIVRRGQRIIDRQTLAQEQAAQREQQWHREKMAALAAMAANVSHEVGNPLAVISGLVEDLAHREPRSALVAGHSRLILEQTARIATMMRQISDFATTPGGAAESVDVNARVKAVCDFLGFERSFRGTPIAFRPAQALPACRIVPDHLNEVMMNLLHAWAANDPEPDRRRSLQVETAARGEGVHIRIGCDCAPAQVAQAVARVAADARFDLARRRVVEMGGRIAAGATSVDITLPPDGAPASG